MVRLGEPLISRVVVWKQLRKRWRAIQGDVCKPEDYCTGCEALTAVAMDSWVLSAVTLCSSDRSQRFGGMHGIHLHSRNVSQARNQEEAGEKVRTRPSGGHT
jgi:hypothetical protein